MLDGYKMYLTGGAMIAWGICGWFLGHLDQQAAIGFIFGGLATIAGKSAIKKVGG
jgi:hypothetical protein